MFCDLVGGTELSTDVDPEQLREIVRAYQETASVEVARFEGHIAQYLGDGLLVYFGYPRAHEDDPQRAVRAGLAVLEAMQVLAASHKGERVRTPSVRIGIHTGLTVVGEMGGGARHGELALGETPNVAARLQSLAEPGTLVISASTHNLLRGLFACEGLGARTARGISRPLEVYRVIGEPEEQDSSGAPRSPSPTPLVGREEELALLRTRWHQVADGGQVALLRGEPGIGKSRLVQALREHVAGESLLRWECRCSPYAQQSSLRPWIEMVERALAFVRGEPPAERVGKIEARLAEYGLADPETIDLWARLLSVPRSDDRPTRGLSPPRLRRKTLEAVVRLLLAQAAQRPVLLIVEDLHWADPSTLELLGILIDQVATANVLILLTARPEFRPPWETRSHLTQTTLGRLPRARTKEMIESIAGDLSLPPPLLDRLVSRSDGVPLFAEELTKTVLSEIHSEDRGGTAASSLVVPATLQDSLMARLDRLGPAKAVAQLGATLGRQFSYELLLAVTSLGEEELERELDRLVDAELLYKQGLPPKARYVFKHALLREAAYESLLRSTRARYHKRIATVLAEQFPDIAEVQPELLAQHFAAAGELSDAVEYWRRAGLAAIQRSASLEALHHLDQALEALGGLPEGSTRDQTEIALRTALGPVLLNVKGWSAPEVKRTYERARDLCSRAGEAPQLFTALWGLWGYYFVGGQLQTALGLGEQLMALAKNQPDPGLLMQAHHMLGPTRLCLGPFTEARSHFETAIALYDREKHRSHRSLYGGHDPCACCASYGAHVHWILGFPDLALERAREGVELARELKHPSSLAHALSMAARFHQLRCEPEAAREVAAAGLELSIEHEFATPQSSFRLTIAWATARRGSPGDGSVQLDEMRAAMQAPASPRVFAPHFLAMIAEVCDEKGRPEEGLAAVNEALSVAAEMGDRTHEAELHRLRGELARQQHGPPAFAEADACFRRALEIARTQGARSWELRAAASLVRLWRGHAKHAEAHQRLAEIYAGFTEGFESNDLKEARALLEPGLE